MGRALPRYPKRYSIGLGSHCGSRDVNSPLTTIVQDLPVSSDAVDDVARPVAGGQLTDMPSTRFVVERPPSSTEPVSKQCLVASGGSDTGTRVESEVELNSGVERRGGQQQQVVEYNPVEGSLARPEIWAG